MALASRPSRPRDLFALCVAILAWASLPFLVATQLTSGPLSQRVNIRWRADVSDEQRATVEREAHLVAAEQIDGATWSYRLQDQSPGNIAALLINPAVEDYAHFNRPELRVSVDRPDWPEWFRTVLGRGQLPLVAIAVGAVAALATWMSRRLLRIGYLAANRLAVLSTRVSGDLVSRHGRLVLVACWLSIAIPYVAVGPNDFEEYQTAVTSTKLSVDALADGALPFWNVDLGLGAPLPLRYHFLSHPIAPLCRIADCHAVLRLVASLHVLLGAIFMGLLAERFTGNQLLASCAALTFLLSSSIVQTMLTDDWPFTAINEAALPVLVYACYAICDGTREQALLWTLVLGGLAGLILGMSFPVTVLAIVAIVALSMDRLRQRLPWLIAAAALTMILGAAQVHHLYEELVRTPAGLVRINHGGSDLTTQLWSLFLRPLSLGANSVDWRSAYFGPLFAICALIAMFHRRITWMLPLRIGFLLGVAGLIVPPRYLFNIQTAPWTYRAELNVFGILLAVAWMSKYLTGSLSTKLRPLALAHLISVVVAVTPPWFSVAAPFLSLRELGRQRLAPNGIADEVVREYQSRPGRVMFAPRAYEILRRPGFNVDGLAINQLPMRGVPTVSAVLWGLTTDELSPQANTLEGELRPVDGTLRNRDLMNLLGVRWILATAADPLAAGVIERRSFPGGLKLYENTTAWPEAFVVQHLPTTSWPRLPDCEHRRFLCADVRGSIERIPNAVEMQRLHDGVRLKLTPSSAAREIVLTQWYRDGWTITEGRGAVERTAEQLVGLRIPAGQDTVTVRFRPTLRMALFAVGSISELAVALCLGILCRRNYKKLHASGCASAAARQLGE